MYILIKKIICPNLKSDIIKMIDAHQLSKWDYVEEEERRRLVYIGEDQYNDVVLRFINTSKDGLQYLKILPTVRLDAQDRELAEKHFGIVLGRFAELLNSHFTMIGCYETML